LGIDVRIADMNWMQVEEYLRHDDRAVLPLGSTEQHSHLRLTVDCILPERVAADAAEPLGVPVFPVVPYGHAVLPRVPRLNFALRAADQRGLDATALIAALLTSSNPIVPLALRTPP
jgi:hypothetical protein